MKYLHIKIVFVILIFAMIFTTKSYAKYVINSNNIAAIINIDRTKPKIEIINARKTNYDKTTNISNVIITIRVTDKNIKKHVDVNKIKVLIDDKVIECPKEILELKQIDNGIEFNLLISNIEMDNTIKILLPNEFIEDESGNATQELEYEIKIVYL